MLKCEATYKQIWKTMLVGKASQGDESDEIFLNLFYQIKLVT